MHPSLSILCLFLLLSSVTCQTTRCGSSWTDANNKCGTSCSSDSGCSNGQRCYTSLKACSTPPTGTSSSVRCGANWAAANSGCGKVCRTNADCTSGQFCFASLSACSGGRPPPVVTPDPPTSNNGGCGYRVTHDQLQRIMGRQGQDLSRFVNPLNSALSRYAMDCPNRITAFLAQVRHETASLTIFFQPRDNGAGSLHMIPQNWGHVCRRVPEIRNMFAQRFSNCGNCECTAQMVSDPMGAMATRAAKEIFADPVAALFSGAWWFAEGAKIPEIFGWKGCGDLRLDADRGLGAPGGSDCRHSGYHQITCCVFWTIGGEAGLGQRIVYYNLARSVIGTGARAISGSGNTFSDTGAEGVSLSSAMIAGIVGGCVGLVIIVVVIIILVVSNRKIPPTEEKV